MLSGTPRVNYEYPTKIGITEEYLLGGISPRTGQMERGKRDTRDGIPSSMTVSARRGIIYGHLRRSDGDPIVKIRRGSDEIPMRFR